MARKDGQSQRKANGNSCRTVIQSMPEKLKMSNGGLVKPNRLVSTRLIMPLRGLSSMIQPFTSNTAGMIIGATTSRFAMRWTRASVRSTIQARMEPPTRTKVATQAAKTIELASAG